MSKHISMGSGCITQEVLLAALQASGLAWHMHPAQQFSILSDALRNNEEVTLQLADAVSEKKLELTPENTLSVTLFAVPIKPRLDFPRSWIRLYAGDKLLYHIDSCAVPSVFGHPDGWDAGNEDDIRKAEILWDNTPTQDIPPGSLMAYHRIIQENDE